MTKIYMVRHAEAEGNLYGRPHAWYDGHLTSLGRRQVKAFGRRMKDVPFAAAYSSDKQRTTLTALAALEGKGVELQITPRLRELHLGEWEDTTWGDLVVKCPDDLYKYSNDTTKWFVKDSEPFVDAQARMITFIREVAKKYPNQNVLCASHGFAIRALLAAVDNVPADKIREVPFCGNTALSVIIVDEDGNCTVEVKNDFSHLKENDEYGSLLRDESVNLTRQVFLTEFDAQRDSTALYELCGVETLDVKRKLDDLNTQIAEVNRCVAANPRSVMTLLKDGDPIGFLALDTEKGRAYGQGWISIYILAERYRDLRLSRVLLGHAVSVYRELGREKIVIDVPANDEKLDRYFKHYAFTDSEVQSEKGENYKVMEYDLVI